MYLLYILQQKFIIDENPNILILCMSCMCCCLQSRMDPVMLLYRESAAINDIIERITKHEESFQSMGAAQGVKDGLEHALWLVKDVEVL